MYRTWSKSVTILILRMSDTNTELEELRIKVEQLRILRDQIEELTMNHERKSRKSKEEPSTAIIVEPREHRALGFVVRNVLDNLPANWSVRIYHGTKNQTFVENLLETEFSQDVQRISLESLGVEDLVGHDSYSKLMISREFTQKIPTETFLVFQTDSMINPSQKDLLCEFIEYDYVGAPWSTGLVGNGGFSLRKRSKMLEIIEKSPYESGNEDMFFALNALRLGFNVPSALFARSFAVETLLSQTFFGVHRVWGYHPNELFDLFLLCPGLSDLIALQDVVDYGDTHTAIIVEPRKHLALGFVVRNVLDNLPANWNVRIYHGTKNQTFVENLLETEFSQDAQRISLDSLGLDNLQTPMEYSKLLSSREFTQKIPTETFIVFQTDSMINPKHKDLLSKFLKYDYVGAPWPWEHLQVGNGGFSLRKRSRMLKVINTTPRYRGAYEDQYFSMGSRTFQLFIPKREEAMEFSIEQVYSPKSFAIHNAWKYLPEKTEQMCEDCPGLATLISLQGVAKE